MNWTATTDGSKLTSLDATELTSGTVADTRLTLNVDLLNAAQSISAVKTFTASPSVPLPTLGGDAANKTYVDNTVSGASSTLLAGNKEATQQRIDRVCRWLFPLAYGVALAAIVTW